MYIYIYISIYIYIYASAHQEPGPRPQHLPICNDGAPRRLSLAECRTCNARRNRRGGGYLLRIRRHRGLGARIRLRLAENQQGTQCRCQGGRIRLNLVCVRCSFGFRTRGKLEGQTLHHRCAAVQPLLLPLRSPLSPLFVQVLLPWHPTPKFAETG